MSVEDPKQERKPFSEEAIVERFGLRIIKPSQFFELHENINFNALEALGVSEEKARDLAMAIVNFKNLPIIIDQFDKDHTSRREWRNQVEATYGSEALAFLKSNKLRVNSFTFINFLFATIDLHTRNYPAPEQSTEKINSIRARYSDMVKEYGDMDVNEKILAVQRLDELFDEVLGLLS